MDGIIEYAQTELATFGQAPLNEVDSLLFSQLCYLDFGKAFPRACFLLAAAEVLSGSDPETRRIALEVLGRLVRLFLTPQATWDAFDSGKDDGEEGQGVF